MGRRWFAICSSPWAAHARVSEVLRNYCYYQRKRSHFHHQNQWHRMLSVSDADNPHQTSSSKGIGKDYAWLLVVPNAGHCCSSVEETHKRIHKKWKCPKKHNDIALFLLLSRDKDQMESKVPSRRDAMRTCTRRLCSHAPGTPVPPLSVLTNGEK